MGREGDVIGCRASYCVRVGIMAGERVTPPDRGMFNLSFVCNGGDDLRDVDVETRSELWPDGALGGESDLRRHDRSAGTSRRGSRRSKLRDRARGGPRGYPGNDGDQGRSNLGRTGGEATRSLFGERGW